MRPSEVVRSIYFHHRFSTNQTATKSLGTPNPCALPQPATAAPSHLLQVPKGAEISPRGSRDTRSRDPQESGPVPPQSPGTRVDRALRRTTRDSTSRSRGAVLPAETRAPHCLTSQGTGSGRPLRPLFPTPWGGGGGSKRREKKSSPPIRAKQTFLCFFFFNPL